MISKDLERGTAMRMSRVILSLVAAALMALPVAANAATVAFDFRASSGGAGFVDPQPLEITERGVTATISSSSIGPDAQLGQWLNGLGVGGAASQAQARLGFGEALTIGFEALSVLEQLTVVDWARPSLGDQTFSLFVDGSFRGNFGTNGPNGEPTVIVFGDEFVGRSFTLVGDAEPGTESEGIFVAAAVVSAIPVPPAAPLLGGALALLWWRKRRSRTA